MTDKDRSQYTGVLCTLVWDSSTGKGLYENHFECTFNTVFTQEDQYWLIIIIKHTDINLIVQGLLSCIQLFCYLITYDMLTQQLITNGRYHQLQHHDCSIGVLSIQLQIILLQFISIHSITSILSIATTCAVTCKYTLLCRSICALVYEIVHVALQDKK